MPCKTLDTITLLNHYPAKMRLCFERFVMEKLESTLKVLRRQVRPMKSKYRGVFYDSSSELKPWRAQVTVNGRSVKRGRYESELAAAIARDRLALELQGPEAFLNFPELA